MKEAKAIPKGDYNIILGQAKLEHDISIMRIDQRTGTTWRYSDGWIETKVPK